MHRVILSDIEPIEAMWLKDQLVRDGLVMNRDFEWKYHPPHWDGFTQEHTKHVEFSFQDAALATFYQLKWS
jgi:hypothetical protein